MPTTPYEETAGTRPRVRRDVLFTETPKGVIFHNADGGFQVASPSAYRFATLLVPHLDGGRTVAEICEGFKEPQKAMVGSLVKALYARGFARPVPAPAEGDAPVEPAVAARFAQQIAYVDHYADGAESRFAAFRNTRVAVLGEGPVARWCALSLIRNGCASVGVEAVLAEGPATAAEFGALRAEAEELTAGGSPAEVAVLPDTGSGAVGWDAYAGYDVVVAAAGRDAFGTSVALLRQGVPEGRLLLPAWVFGGRVVVGPAGTPDAEGCVACAALRLGATGDAAVAADLWSGLALNGPASYGGSGAAPRGPLAAMVGNLLGYEVFRLVTEALPAETRGQVLLQDTASFDVLAERLLPHPRCPFCRARAGAEAVPAEPVDLAEAAGRPVFRPVVAAAPEDGATEGPLADLDRRSLAVRPSVGVFTRYADEPVTQTPLKVGAVEVGLGAAGTRTVVAFDVQHTAGARLRALDAAAAVYAEHVVPTPARTGADSPSGHGQASGRVDPDALTTASGAGGDQVASWVLATSLLTKEPVLVPAGAVRPFGPDNPDRRFEPSRAGAGAGPGLPEASAAGLLSALAHDALRRSVRGAGRTAVIPPAVFDEAPETRFLLRSAGHLGLDVELLDLGEEERTRVSVVLARTRTAERGGKDGHAGPDGPGGWAVGAALDRADAATDALRDLLGAAQLTAEGVLGTEDASGSKRVPDTGDPLLADLDPALVPVTADAPAPALPAVTWADVLERLAAAGRDALVVPTHAADLPAAGIHTVRVLLTRAAGDDR
ncbi:TOMM precursor leader peptide-binding protein [Streptomyces sp. NPDC096068]|uniref:TOMM precursor leader peptide-binding protein n=1 Tax=Streptomyces sp. NPDC096068 TaxID=3155424 RepID=UPI0033289956